VLIGLVEDDFIYEDEEEDEPDVDVENGYYNAKGKLIPNESTNPELSRKKIPKKPSMNFVLWWKQKPQLEKRVIGRVLSILC
jgi:hypothetical protein